MDEQKCFGLVIRSHRQKLDISQEELAARAGLHRTYIGSVERGERNVSLQNIYIIAKALGIKASKLLIDTDKLLERGKS